MAGLLGRLLRGVHAGEKHLLTKQGVVASSPEVLGLGSGAFAHGGAIPARFAAEGIGQNVSPPLAWSDVPEGTLELLLMIEDPGAPLPRPIVHLLATIEAGVHGAAEGGFNVGGAPGWVKLFKGTMGDVGYAGPRPVPGHGPHTYVFQLLALSAAMNFKETPSRSDLLKALTGKVLAWGRLDGTYERA